MVSRQSSSDPVFYCVHTAIVVHHPSRVCVCVCVYVRGGSGPTDEAKRYAFIGVYLGQLAAPTVCGPSANNLHYIRCSYAKLRRRFILWLLAIYWSLFSMHTNTPIHTHTTHLHVVQCTQLSKHTIDDKLHATYTTYMLTMPIYFACGTEYSGMHGMRALYRWITRHLFRLNGVSVAKRAIQVNNFISE